MFLLRISSELTAVGVPTAIGLGRYVSSQLYGIQPNDPWIAVWTVVLLTLVSVTNTFFWSYWTLAYLRITGTESVPSSSRVV